MIHDSNFTIDKSEYKRVGRSELVIPKPSFQGYQLFVVNSLDFWISLAKLFALACAFVKCTSIENIVSVVLLDTVVAYFRLDFMNNLHRRGNICIIPVLLVVLVASFGQFRWNFELTRILFEPLFKQAPLYLFVKFVDGGADSLPKLRHKALDLRRPLLLPTLMGNLLLATDFSKDNKYDLSLNQLLVELIIDKQAKETTGCIVINLKDLSCATCLVTHEAIFLGSMIRPNKKPKISIVELVVLIKGTYGDNGENTLSILSLRHHYTDNLLLRNLRNLKTPRGHFLEALVKIYPAEKVIRSLLLHTSRWENVFNGFTTVKHLLHSFPDVKI